jgi:hypothetical protein
MAADSDDNIIAKVVDKGIMSADDFASLIDAISGRSCMIISGCLLKYVSSSKIHIDSGYVQAYGRLVRITGQDLSVPTSSSATPVTMYVSIAISPSLDPTEAEVSTIHFSTSWESNKPYTQANYTGTCYCPIGKYSISASGVVSDSVQTLQVGKVRQPLYGGNRPDGKDLSRVYHFRLPNGILVCFGRRRMTRSDKNLLLSTSEIVIPEGLKYTSEPIVIGSMQDWNNSAPSSRCSFVVSGVSDDFNRFRLYARLPNMEPWPQPSDKINLDVYATFIAIGYCENYAKENDIWR